MIEIERFSFSNDLFYQEQTSMVILPGVTLLRGINYDAGPSEGNSNGTGKTRLPQLMSAFITGSSERGKLSKMVLPKFKGEIQFRNTITNDLWNFSFDKDDKGWDIRRNGEVYVDFHQNSECQKILTQQVGFARDDWANFAHINRHSISVLLQGKPAERRAYLERFFNIDEWYEERLNEYKELKKSLEDQINLLNLDQAKLGQILETLAQLPDEQEIEEKEKQAKTLLVSLAEKQKHLTAEIQSARTQLAYWQEYYDFSMQAQGRPKLKVLEAQSHSLRARYNELKAQEKTVQIVKRKEAQLRSLGPFVAPEPPVEARELEGETIELEKTLLILAAKDRLREKLKKIKAQLPEVKENSEELRDEKKALSADLSHAKLHLDLLKDGDKCSRCLQPFHFKEGTEDFDSSTLKVKISRITKRLSDIEDIEDKIALTKRLTQQMNEVLAEGKALPKTPILAPEIQKEIERRKAYAKDLRIYQAAKTEYDQGLLLSSTLQGELNALGYPGILENDFSEEIEKTRIEILGVEQDLHIAQKLSSLMERVSDLPEKKDLQKALEKAEASLQEVQEVMNDTHKMHGELSAQLRTVLDLSSKKVDLEDKIKKKSHVNEEYILVDSLAKFFSAKGFKAFELRRRCNLLVEKANYWSPVFFQEQHEWSLPKDNESIDLLVQPVNHRKTKPFLASLLSAGEENRAEKVLLFSQLELAPKKKSLNLLFLDEIEGHLDKPGKIAFTEVVIPKLRETFPNKAIIIISHEASLQESPSIDHLWVAEKRDRKSTLKCFENFNRRR